MRTPGWIEYTKYSSIGLKDRFVDRFPVWLLYYWDAFPAGLGQYSIVVRDINGHSTWNYIVQWFNTTPPCPFPCNFNTTGKQYNVLPRYKSVINIVWSINETFLLNMTILQWLDYKTHARWTVTIKMMGNTRILHGNCTCHSRVNTATCPYII